MLSVNNQRRPSVGTNVTPNMGVRRPSDGNVQPIITNDSTSNNGQIKSPTSSTITGKYSSNGHFPITEPRSRSSSASSMQSSGSYLQTDLPEVYGQLEHWSNSSLQQQNIIPAEIDTDSTTNETISSGRRHSPPSPVSTNADGSNVSSPTSAAAASLTRRDHITGHTHDRSRSASFDGEIEPSAWTMDRVLEWLDDNSFSEYKTIFSENNLCGEKFFALGEFQKIKKIVESRDRYRLINAIRKIGDVRPKRQSFSNKSNQPDMQSPNSGGQLSSSNSINEQNSPTTPVMQSVPSSTEQISEQISKQKPLKLSTSSPDLRSKGHITSPVIGPRTTSLGWGNKNNNSSNSTIISSKIEEIDSPNENTIAPLMNNNDKLSKSSGIVPPTQQLQNFNNNPSAIQNSSVSSPSEDIITSPLSPNSNRRIIKIHGEAIPDNGETNIFVGLPKNIQVTFDNKNFRVVDLSGREDPSTIKDVIFSQLEIPQNEREYFSFYLTEIGQKEIGPAIDDETLIQKCKKADDRGTLKLLIKRKQLSDQYYGQSHNQGKMIMQDSPPNLISGGDQSNKLKTSKRTTPPELSPPHFSPELNHSLPFNNNNDERKYYNNFPGGFNPSIKNWKEGLIPLSGESQDIREPKDVTFPMPHVYPPEHKPSYRTPSNSNFSPYAKNHRRHDRDNLNYSISSSSQHRVGGGDYPRGNAPSKPRSQPSKHPSALQPANGLHMNTRRPPSRDSIIRNSDKNAQNPPPPPIPPKPQQSLMPLYNHTYNSKSQPHLPLSQNSTINLESERYQHKHAVTSDPDLPLRGPQPVSQSGSEFNRPPIVQDPVNALFPEEGLKPPTQDGNSSDEDFWAEIPKSIKNKDNQNKDDDKPKSPSYTSKDSDDDEDFWAQVPISSKSQSSSPNSGQSANSLHNEKTIVPAESQNKKLPDDDKEQDIRSKESIDDTNETGKFGSTEDIPSIPASQERKRPSKPSGLARTVSMRRGVTESWVVRPTAEDLFEQLEHYFPGHDLDKPIVDANGSSVQPQNSSDGSPSTPVPEKKPGKIQRGKSIRAAAREAHEREQLEKKERSKKLIGAFNTIKAQQRLSRKPTTKLWDKKIVLVSSHKKPCPSDVPPEECVSAERKPVIWVKGELIGKGTFGKVFLAMNVNSSEIMAVKQIELPTTKSDRMNERQQNLVKSFTDEMEILKDLDHDHIVQYIGFERTEEAINIFLEYVNGGSIGTCLRIYGAFKEPVVRSFTRQILLGLQYLHNKGILHRDIKADNILVDEEGCCKISDFGISKKSDHAIAYDINSNMSLQGTIFWMAPEVFASTNGYSAKVDIWSLGCVVLEMFAGERPWNDLTDLAAMFKLGSEKKAPPIREDIVMSPEARNFIDQCFIIEPDVRPTAEQLLQHSFAQEDPNFHFKEYISIPGHNY